MYLRISQRFADMNLFSRALLVIARPALYPPLRLLRAGLFLCSWLTRPCDCLNRR
jgi:hypothetical protein